VCFSDNAARKQANLAPPRDILSAEGICGKRPMRNPVEITTPFPKPSEVARLLQIPTDRARRIARMADAIVADKDDKRKSPRAPAIKRLNSAQKSPIKKSGSDKA